MTILIDLQVNQFTLSLSLSLPLSLSLCFSIYMERRDKDMEIFW